MDIIVEDAILDRVLEIAHGQFMMDRNFRNVAYTGKTLLQRLSTFARGAKDGTCILQGAVVEPPAGARGTQRLAVNMSKNCLLMADFDQGDTPEEIIAKITAQKLFAVVWTTHSHMKPITEVPEKPLLLWLKNKGIDTSDADEAQVIDYLREFSKIYPKFLTDAKLIVRGQKAGIGRFYKMQHAPLPRCRALFILKDKFDFATRKGSQEQVIGEWKALYAGFCENVLKTTYDTKCVDPSRLMYLPRIADDADISQHSITVVPGGFLDLEKVTPAVKGVRAPAVSGPGIHNFATGGGSGSAGSEATAFKTPWLKEFLAKFANDFEAETWVKDHDEQELCPFSDHHTPTPSGVDTGFKAWNASNRDSGFNMQCSHACGGDPQRGQNAVTGKQDRALYLDALCVKFGITNASELREYCPDFQAEEAEKARARTVQHATVQEMIAAITAESTADDITAVLRIIATRAEGMQDDIDLEALANRGPVGTRRLRTDLNECRQERARQNPTAAPTEVVIPRRAVPENLAEVPHIWLDWDWPVVVRATKERIVHLNIERPHLFARPEGGVMRVQDRPDGSVQAVTVKIPQWAAELSEQLSYREIINDVEIGCQPPAALKEIMVGTAGLKFEPLDRIVRVPVFAADGSLRTGRGYDKALQCYLDPEVEFLPLPDKISSEDVDLAVSTIMEAIRDFPFSDTMNGDDKLPVKTDQIDSEGFAVPNWERGVSSRANMVAMILQPFVRNMIGGPCPAYHVDKSAAGTGAGFLVDVAHIIAEGSGASAQPMSYDNEEFRKSITATLRSGANFIFIDNVNRVIDSGELAAALTAGKWRDRIIMSSDVALIPMKALWVFAGNNLSFTHELMRRNVPIRMDAAVPRPASDRGRKDFKHMPLQDWLLDNRLRLVWSCHVLVQNWIDTWDRKVVETEHGPIETVFDKKWGNGKLLSFDHYAGVMSGILDTAGIPGFLANIEDYLAQQDVEHNSFEELAQRMYENYPTTLMTAKDILGTTKNPVSHEIELELPIENKDEHRQLIDLGKLVKKHMVGHTFDVQGKPEASGEEGKVEMRPLHRVKLLINNGKNRKKYRFEILEKGGR